MTAVALLKAETVVAVHLMARHRTVRLVAVLALAALVAARGTARPFSVVLFVASAVGVVAASRPLAPGAALELARRAAARPVISAAGRFTAVVLLVLATTAVALPVTGSADAAAARRELVGAVLGGAALAAPVLALAAVLGASAAAGLGLLGAMLGQAPPSVVQGVLAPWRALQGGAVLLWNALPLPWRVERWMDTPGAGLGDAAVLALWLVIGVTAVAWVLVRTPAGEG